MVQIDNFTTPDSLLRPELQTGKERDDERLDQLKDAARGQLPVFEAYMDATRAEGFAPNSGFETHERFLVFNTRNRIFDVLRQGGAQYEDTLRRGGSGFSGVESEVWRQRRTSTLRSIENRGTSANTSLLVAEGYEQILGSAMGELESDWQKQTALTEQYFENRGFWSKIGGLWRKKRFDIFNRRFTKRLEKRKTKIQVSIDMVKGRKERDVKNAENAINGRFRDANDRQKEQLWNIIKNIVNNPTRNLAAATRSFGVGEGTDFLEALKNLKIVEDVARGRRSTELGQDADEKLKRLNDREDVVRRVQPNYKGLQTLLETAVTRPEKDTELLSTDKLAMEIEKGLIRRGVNLREDVYGGDIDGISQAEKMIFFVEYLAAGANQVIFQNLDPNLKRKILKYLLDLDSETKSGQDEKEGKAFKQADDDLKEVLISGNFLANTTTGLPKLKELQDLGGFPDEDFYAIISLGNRFSEVCDRKKNAFEEFKKDIPKDYQEDFQKQWEALSRLSTALKELLPKWEEERRAHAKWEKKKNFHEKETKRIDKEITKFNGQLGAAKRVKIGTTIKKKAAGLLSNTVNFEEISAAEIEAKTKQIEFVQEKILKKEDEKSELEDYGPTPEFTHPAKLKDALGEIAEFNTDFATRSWRNVVPALATETSVQINTRIHVKLEDEFLAEAEKQYVTFLEKNTTEQWNILQNIREGATVNLKFRETTDLGHIQMPEDLHENVKPVSTLRVIRKNADGIILEGVDKIYVLNGPSVKEGRAKSNLGVYEKVDNAGDQINTQNPPSDFSIPHSNPNQQAIVLSMQIS